MEEDTDFIPVRDVNENNNVKKNPKKSKSVSMQKPGQLVATKRPRKMAALHNAATEDEKRKLATAEMTTAHTGDTNAVAVAQHEETGIKLIGADVADSNNVIRGRQDVARWDRDVLEDKYLRLLDNEVVLKRHCQKQEERIKKMSVKLIRLASDKKSSTSIGRKSGQDGAVAETLAELEAQVRKLEKEKQQMEEKFVVMREQLQVAVASSHKGSQVYESVPPRIDTGIKRDARLVKSMRVSGPRVTSPKSSLPPPTPQKLPRYGHSLLEEAREQIQYMESIVEQQNEQISIYEQDIENLKKEMRMKEIDFEEDLLKIKQQATGVTRTSLQENVDLIRLQREVKDKAARILAMQGQYDGLEINMRALKDSHSNLLKEIELLNSQLLEEQSIRDALKNQLKRNPADMARIKELEEASKDAKKEILILKEANEKLVTSAFDMEREREWRKRENALKVQIAQLEATLKADLGEKGSILDRLTAEREAVKTRENEFRQLQKEYFKVKEQNEELQEKMKFFTKESAVDFAEVEEALILLKQRKEKQDDSMSFLHKVDEEKSKDLEKQMLVLQADHAETIEELEKTRNLLIVQHQINKDYQIEVEAVTRKLEENRQEYEVKVDEYAQLLDIRAARIRKLELQLRDVAYGTRQYKLHSMASGADDDMAGSDVEEVDETVHLERGENLFEIHIEKLTLTREALKSLGDDEPSLFCTWEFFEHETQATPVIKGANPRFEFTSQYIVKVDDFFLHHLQKESTMLEVHQAVGTEYQTVACCRLRFRDIFDKPHGRVHGAVDILLGAGDDVARVQLGTLHFWVRLRVPIDQALRLYKERTKALGYISTNDLSEHQKEALTHSAASASTAAAALSGQQREMQAASAAESNGHNGNINELHVRLVKASDLRARQQNVQPSAYCIYKFFDFPDHDTAIVHSSSSPVFNDLRSFPVVMAADLDSYLKSTSLEIFVFDDTDAELMAYLGMASVPLMPLAHSKAIKGTFELKKMDGSVNGTLEVLLKWQCSYVPPDAATKTPAQMSMRMPQSGSSLALMSGEQLLPAASGPRQPALLLDGYRATSSMEPVPTQIAASKRTQLGAESSSRTSEKLLTNPVQEQQMKTVQQLTAGISPQAKKTKNVEFTAEVKQKSPMSGDAAAPTPSVRQPLPSATPLLPAASASSKGQTPNPALPPSFQNQLPLSGRDQPTAASYTAASDPDASVTVSSLSSNGSLSASSSLAGKPASAMTGHDATGGLHQAEEKSQSAANGFNTEITSDVEEMASESEARPAVAADDTLRTSHAEEIDDEDTHLYDDNETLNGSGDIDLPVDGTQGSFHTDTEPALQSDSDGVVSPIPRRQYSSTAKESVVTISINHLSIDEGSSVLSDTAVQRLFVAYTFLQRDPADLETPVSLPKPDSAHKQLQFNFRRVFHVDAEENIEDRQFLASMLLPEAPDQGRICFTVVSEPPEDDQSSECMDVGSASVSLGDILKTRRDLIDANIDVMDIVDPSRVIGSLNVTVECLAVLQALNEDFVLS